MLIVQRLRGILLTALTWALPWAAVGGATVVAFDWLARAPGFHTLTSVEFAWGLFLDGARFFALVGAVAGALFAGVVAVAERRRTFATLNTGRMVVWGALSGAALPLLVGIGAVLTGAPSMLRDLFLAGIGASLGAGSAAVMLRIARRAMPRSEVPPSIEDDDSVHLAEAALEVELTLSPRGNVTTLAADKRG